MTSPRIGSLFSGSGMLDEGVRAVLSGTVAWHAEVEPAAVRVLEHRYPGVPNLGDVTAVDWSQVEPVDVLTGGSPCQDVSHAGARRGMRAGTRSGLWSAMVDAIDVLRPRLVVWENVRGVLSAEADSALEPCAGCVGDGDDGAVLRALGRVLGDLAGVGYDARWCGLRAADVGAPHGRFRVFVVATDAERGGRVGWASDARRGPVGRVAAAGSGRGAVADAGSGPFAGPAAAGDGLRVAAERGGRAVADAEGTRDGGGPDVVRGPSGAASRAGQDEGRFGDAAFGGGATTADADRDAVRVEPVAEPRRCGSPVARNDVQWGQYEPAIRRWERVLGRPAPAPTETGPKGGQRLSPRFTEWMQGWPDGWVTDVPGVSRNEALKLCGNGVVPQQAGEALRRLLEVDAASQAQDAGALLPTPKAGTNRASRHAMVEIRQWSAPSLEQAVEIAQGILPREFRSWDEVPGRSGGAA